MTALYEIANEYSEVFNQISQGDFDDATIEDTLAPIAKSFEEKAKNVVAWVNNVDSDLEKLEEHKKNIDSRIKSRKKEIEFYRNYIKTNMIKMGIKSLKCPLFDILIKKSNPRLEKYDEMSIPPEYIKTETITKIDDVMLKNDLKNGKVVPGASLQETESLTIKLK